MFCYKCGYDMPDDFSFCPRCGAGAVSIKQDTDTPFTPPAYPSPVYTSPVPEEPTPEPEDTAPPVYAPPTYTPPEYPNPNFDPSRYAYPGYGTPAPAKPEFPMKWFKFTIYVQLFLNALGNLGSALMYFSGLPYGNNVDLIYRAFPGLQALDLLMAVVCIAMAIYAVFTRMQLARFKKNGPLFLYTFLALNISTALFYNIAATVITGESLLTIQTVANIVTIIILLICDCIYFTKRRELFQD